MRLICRWRGHRWLMENHERFDYICITDICLRCRAKAMRHAGVLDDRTKLGDGGCMHGTPGRLEVTS